MVLYKVILLGVVDTGYFVQDFLWLFFLNGPKVYNSQQYCRWTLFVQQKTLLTYTGLLYVRQHDQASILHFNIDKMSQLAASLPSITNFFHSCTQQTKLSYT